MPIVVATTANEAPIVKIISSPPSSLPPSTDGNLAGAAQAPVESQGLDMLQDDAIQLSQVASLEAADDSTGVDLEKVAALRQAITDGSFQVDAQAVYTGLVADAWEMIDTEPT